MTRAYATSFWLRFACDTEDQVLTRLPIRWRPASPVTTAAGAARAYRGAPSASVSVRLPGVPAAPGPCAPA